MARIVCLGEGMVELSNEAGAWSVGFGGDTLNTAIHLARAGHDVAYLTAIGNDAFSRTLRAAWEAEGIDCDLVLTHPTRQVGLYAIATDAAGERSFGYWRDTSAARALFELEAAEATLLIAEKADLLCFSLISLAILPPEGRERLLRLAAGVRARGGRVAFDGNYRARLWESPEAAAHWRDRAIATASFGLPTLEDEAAIARDNGASDECEHRAAQVEAHWQSLGCSEVIVKLGARGCRLPDGEDCPVPQVLHPVDTSGAGDAFNGGYLGARMNDAPIIEAAKAGHALAGWNVMRKGAIPCWDGDAPYVSCQEVRYLAPRNFL
ncbi:sugar kinase [Novosphingobium sp. ZW T3_23]|uniref:sugar kinase n=1 Tax=Novosphingobium sp. ZW T3_23 TaxID=3378084 RepID=UPI003854CB0E